MRARLLSLLLALLTVGLLAAPALAAAPTRACRLPGYVTARPQRPCPAVRPTRVGSNLLGPIGRAFGHLFDTAAARTARTALEVLAAVVLRGAAGALRITGSLIGATTRPALQSTWFSTAYWRMAGISAVLTVPFLFAAGVHALVRSDIGLLARAAFGYLPLAMLGVSIASPLTMLVLRATDEMSAIVAGAAGDGDSSFLARAAADLTTPSLIHGDIVVAFVIAGLTVMATVALWIELVIRSAAVDVIVLMLPLFFAAMVWPARRTWAVRSIETLVALILAKFAIVAVLALGGSALENFSNGPAALLTGATLILLATASPWMLLRLLPLHEVAAAAAGGLSREPRAALGAVAARARGGGPRAAGDPGGGDGQEAAENPLGPEEREAALRRILFPNGAIAGGGGVPLLSSGSAADGDAGAAAGIAAIARAGGGHRASSDPPREASPPRTHPRDGGADPRGPIDAPFDGGEWTDFVLGDSGEERMEPPRRASDPPPADGGTAEPGSSAAPESPPPVDPPPALDPPSPLDPPGGLDSPPPPPAADEPSGEEPA